MAQETKQKSSKIREDWVQVDALCCGMDWDEEDLTKPQILVEDVFGSSHPGSVHLDRLAAGGSIRGFPKRGKTARVPGKGIC